MYFPFLRGKREEINVINLAAAQINNNRVLPIIEPVEKTRIESIVRNNLRFILIANPSVPARPLRMQDVITRFITPLANYPNLTIGYIITDGTPQEIQQIGQAFNTHEIAFIHIREFNNATQLNQAINGLPNVAYNIFRTDLLSPAYVGSFDQAPKVTLQDFFAKQVNNTSYPQFSYFTDTHLSYAANGFHGMGDYLTIGSAYSETGGLPHAVAIHMSYNDPAKLNHVYINHYVSTNAGGTANVQRKFLQANQLLVNSLGTPQLAHINTQGTAEFRNILGQARFPGLGMVKRLSMIHHLEIMEGLV